MKKETKNQIKKVKITQSQKKINLSIANKLKNKKVESK